MLSSPIIWAPLTVSIGLLILFYVIKEPKFWLALFILSLPVFFTSSGEGISVFELAVGGFHLIAIIFWMMFQLAQGRKIIRYWEDYLLILFIILTLGNIVIAYSNNVRPIDWLSEYSLFLLMLYYFPFREIFGKDERNFKHFLFLLTVMSVLMVAYAIYDYKNRLGPSAVFAYSLQASRSVLLGPFFAFFLVFAIPSFFEVRSKFFRWFLMFSIVANSGGLIQTFTRSLWVSVFGALLVTMLFLKFRQNLTILVSALVIMAASYGTAVSFYPNLTRIATKLIEHRVQSSGQVQGGDLSMETRFIETQTALNKLQGNYLGGNGLRSKFTSWTPILQMHVEHAFIHIGYVSLLYKLGAPLAILFLSIGGLITYRATVTISNLKYFPKGSFYRPVAIAAFASIPVFAVLIFVAGIIDTRYGMVLIAMLMTMTIVPSMKLTEFKDAAKS